MNTLCSQTCDAQYRVFLAAAFAVVDVTVLDPRTGSPMATNVVLVVIRFSKY